jgi:uncharacterized protein (TIGR02145 family)
MKTGIRKLCCLIIIALLFTGFKSPAQGNIKIGNQTWMSENLNVSTFNNGDPITEVKNAEEWKKAFEYGLSAWCYYKNDLNNGKKYGKLYNWHAINDPRGLAPAGWHIPTDGEWTITIDYLGGEIAAGPKLVLFGETGFNGLPSGIRSNNGNFTGIRIENFWWSSTLESSKKVWVRNLNVLGQLERVAANWDMGLPVRCIKDDLPAVMPVQPVVIPVKPQKQPEKTKPIEKQKQPEKPKQPVEKDKPYIKEEPGTLADSRDGGVTYQTIKIGTQIWMAENLNVSTFLNGDPISEAKTDEEWKKAGVAKKPAWCYLNNDSNNIKYGKLYNWYAVQDARGLAPKGWHVSGEADWQKMINYLGGNERAPAKLKAGNGWTIDILSNNESGFAGLPGNWRTGDGIFLTGIQSGCWWTTSYKNYIDAAMLYTLYVHGKPPLLDLAGTGSNKKIGASVRCVKN